MSCAIYSLDLCTINQIPTSRFLCDPDNYVLCVDIITGADPGISTPKRRGGSEGREGMILQTFSFFETEIWPKYIG